MTRLRRPSPLEKVIGGLLGVAIGDALGMPWETMSHKEIMLATGGRGIAGFSSPVQTRIKDTMNLEIGSCTDDWQLTRAIARSLVAKRKFDLMDIIKEQLVEIEDSDSGFGRSTSENLLMIRESALSDWKICPLFRLPKASELKGTGNGNGIAMKIMPLAIFFHDRPDDFLEAVIQLSNLTHRDPQAMLAAYALGRLAGRLYQQSIGLGSKEQLCHEIKQAIQETISQTLKVQQQLIGEQTDFALGLFEVGRLVLDGGIADVDVVRKKIGVGFHCAESVPFSIAMFLRHPEDFRAAAIETINCGGDTDTNASIVGALVGINCGVMAIPEKWRTFRKDYEEAVHLASTLYNVINDL